jgi:ribosomal protein S18 acetylase RimI-like enzyme
MLTIHSLENVSDDLLYEAFRDAFKDYEIQLNKREFLRLLHRRGFMPQLSFGAFDGDHLVAFTFNGTGPFTDRPTAYDTGTGTLEAYRGKGLAGRIFNHSIPHLKRAGISRYLLEVLQHNESAVSLYRKLGFRVSREFNYFSEESTLMRMVAFHRDPAVMVLPDTLSEKRRMKSFWDHLEGKTV